MTRRNADHTEWTPLSETAANKSPVMMNGGRAARSRESAYQRNSATAANTIGIRQAATRTVWLARRLIHRFASPPPSDRINASTGRRTRASEAASNPFLITKAPGSLIPLPRNASRNRNNARDSKRRFEERPNA